MEQTSSHDVFFAEVEGSAESVFHNALKKYFGGKTDQATLARL
jgi:hypothetical protein